MKSKNLIKQYNQPLVKLLASKKKKILIADDDSDLQYIFNTILEEAGYDVELKGNGHDLLKNDFTMPDLFLIDKLLSGVNGLDVCRYLKRNKATKNIPVVMISASPNLAGQALDAGADDYIEKPFEIRHLLEVIRRNISVKENEMITGLK